MTAGQYPFREAADEKLPAQTKLKAMFPRIVKANFKKPDWISPSCIDLLEKMMTVDSDERIEVADVMKHPWYLEGASSDLLLQIAPEVIV